MGIVKRQSIKGILTYALGAGIHFFTTLIIMNKFLPETYFAVFRSYFALITILGFIGLLGMNVIVGQQIPLLRLNKKDERQFNFATLAIAIIGSGILAVLLVVFKENISNWCKPAGNTIFPMFYYCIPIASFFGAIQWYFEFYSIATHRLTAPAIVREILNRGLLLLGVLGYSFEWWSIEVFFWIFGFTYALAAIILAVYCVAIRGFKVQITSKAFKIPEFTSSISYAAFNFGIVVFAICLINMDQSIAYKLLTDVQTSSYGLAMTIASMITIPYKPLAAILTPFMHEAWSKNDFKKLNEISVQSSINLTALGVLLFVLLWANMPNYFNSGYCKPIYFGLKMPLLILALGRVLDYASGCSTELLNTSPAYKKMLLFLVISFTIGIVSFYFLGKQFGEIGLAFGVLIQYLVFNGLKYRTLKKQFYINAYPAQVVKFLFLGLIILAINFFIPNKFNWIIDSIIRTLLIVIIYFLVLVKGNWLPDLNKVVSKFLPSFNK
jgi:O-antigen/teichoic acid export membrane protein